MTTQKIELRHYLSDFHGGGLAGGANEPVVVTASGLDYRRDGEVYRAIVEDADTVLRDNPTRCGHCACGGGTLRAEGFGVYDPIIGAIRLD